MEIERHRISHMTSAAAAMQELVHQWIDKGTLPEADWSKIKTLEFQDTFKSRQAFVGRLDGRECVSCSDFEKHVCSAPYGGDYDRT